MREVELARLTEKYRRIALELEMEAARLRRAGKGSQAIVVGAASSNLLSVARSLGQDKHPGSERSIQH